MRGLTTWQPWNIKMSNCSAIWIVVVSWIGIMCGVFIKLVCSYWQVPASGMLIITDEEKKTFIAEGYPVPTKWPLSKQDEKNLKKVQRKIKNKVELKC